MISKITLCIAILLVGVSCFAAPDARVWVPSDNDTTPDAQHAERGFEVDAIFTNDPNIQSQSTAMQAGVHFRVLQLVDNMFFETHERLSVASSIGGDRKTFFSGDTIQAGGEAGGLICEDAHHCFLVGAAINVDINQYTKGDVTKLPTPYMPMTVPEVDAEGGYLISKNNKTLILKVIGGVAGDAQTGFYTNNSHYELFGEAGVSGQAFIGNKLMVIASVVERLGLLDNENQLTEGRLKIQLRLWKSPNLESSRGVSVKGLFLEFETRFDHGQLRGNGRDVYPDKLMQINTLNTEGGLNVQY